jgi:hypothetical protein
VARRPHVGALQGAPASGRRRSGSNDHRAWASCVRRPASGHRSGVRIAQFRDGARAEDCVGTIRGSLISSRTVHRPMNNQRAALAPLHARVDELTDSERHSRPYVGTPQSASNRQVAIHARPIRLRLPARRRNQPVSIGSIGALRDLVLGLRRSGHMSVGSHFSSIAVAGAIACQSRGSGAEHECGE